MYMYIYIHTCIHTYTYIYTSTIYIHKNTHTHTCTHRYACSSTTSTVAGFAQRQVCLYFYFFCICQKRPIYTKRDLSRNVPDYQNMCVTSATSVTPREVCLRMSKSEKRPIMYEKRRIKETHRQSRNPSRDQVLIT